MDGAVSIFLNAYTALLLRSTTQKQGDTTIDLQLFQLLRQVQAYLDCHPRVVDVLHPNKELVWPCEAWLFPKGEHKKFSALPTSSDDQRSSLDETYISKEAGRTASGNNTFEGAPLVIANSPLPDHMDALWSRCGTKFCADGGANRVHDWHIANKHDPHTKHYFPDYLIGDMDSVLAEVRSIFASGVRSLSSSPLFPYSTPFFPYSAPFFRSHA